MLSAMDQSMTIRFEFRNALDFISKQNIRELMRNIVKNSIVSQIALDIINNNIFININNNIFIIYIINNNIFINHVLTDWLVLDNKKFLYHV